MFQNLNGNDFMNALKRAMDVYKEHPEELRNMQINALNKDVSWYKTAKEYLELYKSMITSEI